MAVSRGGVAFWVGCVRIHGRRQHIGSFNKPLDLQWIYPTRCLSSASWALAPPNSLRYQTVKRAVPSHPSHHANRARVAYHEDDWEDSLGTYVLVRPNELVGEHAAAEFPSFGRTRLAELLAPGNRHSSEFSFLLTTVDGSREDDISVSGFGRSDVRPRERRHGCFRSLFEAERCPAPYTYGSPFYCFHSSETERVSAGGLNSRRDVGLKRHEMEEEMPQLHPASLYSHEARTVGSHNEGDSEGEQKLALAYERLRTELPNFFRKKHDYTMYSHDLEFINGLLNTKTRGRAIYQFTLSLWRLLCLFYFADARLEVLKLTKHMEDGTIKARWRLKGLPFLTLMLRFYRKDKSHLYRSYDAFSTFYIGHDGLIHCHKVEKVMPAPPPVVPRVTSLLASALVALGLEENRPALNLLPLLLSSLRQVRD
ncbi:uncharacterized protein C6orf136 homolog [Corythoichthys intestinalis]|uniref:uncharacterized protein C6orf136 homolog n=1 Tax=Corythoichthys intestinalis TaxID=161448 RepID=UPI0025A4D0EA|nr:uncharacterized protein C6orf136 homolog [Corythoichthys intestinalis]XP_061808320.1 uncharacterized protein LOC133599525 [Nerophis lumbriciformis]